MAGTIASSFPEQGILDNIATTALGLADAQYAWGQQQFAQNSLLTAQVVGNYLSSAGTLTSAAKTDLAFYQNTFMPEMQQLVNDANDYASSARIQQRMGMAESQVAQSFDQQRQNALADLQSYGIDPSSGRYAALDAVERAQQAAAQAGAGNMAELQTEATGRALRSEAIQVGQRLPGQFIAEESAGNQALAGAENAQLANSKLGLDMLGSPKDYLGTGMGLKYPPTGGTGGGSGKDPFGNEGTSGSKAPPYVNAGGPSTPGYTMPNNTSGYNPGGGSSNSGGGPRAGILNGTGNNGALDTSGGDNDYNMQSDPSLAGAPGSDVYGPTNPDYDTSNSNTPGGSNDMTMGDQDYQGSDSGAIPSGSNSPGGANDMTMGDQGGDQGGDDGSSNNSNGDSSYPDPGYDDSGYARGGAVNALVDGGPPDMAPGMRIGGAGAGASPNPHQVPTVTPDMSPTGGKATDDVSARLNVGEFVIPRDVAAWKGQEFFQKLIESSRKLRGVAPAKGQMKPSLNTPPTFHSPGTGGQGTGAIPTGG